MSRPRKVPERTSIAVADRSVAMSNALARGAQGLGLSEKRVIAIALAKTDSIPAMDLVLGQRAGWSVRLLAQEYAETYDVDLTTAYEQLKFSAKALLDRKWKTITPSEKAGGKPRIREGNWVSSIEYGDGTGVVTVAFTAEVAPHLLALRSHFTTYKLKQTAALRSIYAWRLFECLQSWMSEGKWSPSMEEFQAAMEPPESCRNDFAQLRRRVIEPAVQELRQKDRLLVEWEPSKSGRKVTGLAFTFSPNPQGELPL